MPLGPTPFKILVNLQVRVSSSPSLVLFSLLQCSPLLLVPAYSPSCRDPTSCYNLTQLSCDICYQNGGVVDPSKPYFCYCPASITYNSSSSISCSPTVQLCNGSFICDPSCLTCAGSSNTQCYSCVNSSQVLFQSGSNAFGICVAPCLSPQYLDTNATCQTLDCTSLSDCNGQGTCFPNTTTHLPACACNSTATGPDCSLQYTCSDPDLNYCSGNGTCALNSVTGSLYCQCNVGWTGNNCSTQVSYATSTLWGSEVGGNLVTITSSVGFTLSDNVTCTFGGAAVTGLVVPPGAYCIVPPYYSYLVIIPFALLVNGTSMLSPTSKFTYTYSGQLPAEYEQPASYSSFFLQSTTFEIDYQDTSVYYSGNRQVQVYLYQWNFDPFDINVPNPVLVDLGVIASGQNNGIIRVNISQPFSWNTALYIVSVRSGLNVSNGYASFFETADSATQCTYFGDNAISTFNAGGPFQACPSPGYTSTVFPACSSVVMEPAMESSQTCVADPDTDDVCLYPNGNWNSWSTTTTWYQLWEPFKPSLSKGPVVQYFAATQLPKFFCCGPTSSKNNDIPSMSEYLHREPTLGDFFLHQEVLRRIHHASLRPWPCLWNDPLPHP